MTIIKETFRGKALEIILDVKQFVTESNLSAEDFYKLIISFQMDTEKNNDLEDFNDLYEFIKLNYDFAKIEYEFTPLQATDSEIDSIIQLKYIN